MTREEAIEVLKHTEDNIKYDERREEIYFTDKWVQAYEMAIAALREQEQRSKGCDFCREDNEGYYRMLGTFYLTNPFHKGEYDLNGGGRKPRKIAFCPMCGRKLEVEHEN